MKILTFIIILLLASCVSSRVCNDSEREEIRRECEQSKM